MDWVGKSELLHRAPRLYTQVYSPGGNLKQNKHWRVTLEPRIARYRGILHPWTCRSSHRRSSWWCLLPSSCWSPRWCLLPSASGLTEEVFPRTAIELIELLAVHIDYIHTPIPNSVLNSGGLRLIALECV